MVIFRIMPFGDVFLGLNLLRGASEDLHCTRHSNILFNIIYFVFVAFSWLQPLECQKHSFQFSFYG